MPNPFFYGGLIRNPAQFVERRAELQRIWAALEVAHSGQLQSISLVGPRRIGKSSLLYHVAQTFARHLTQPQRYRVAYVDLTEPHCATQAGLHASVLTQLGAPPSAPVSLIAFAEQLKQLRTTQNLCPVVCLDEFEQLTRHPQEFDDVFFNAWRSLANASHVAFIVASHAALHDLMQAEKLTSPFHNVFTAIALGEMSELEARSLVNLGRFCDRPFTQTECDALLKLAGQHPYKLQLAGWLLYEAKAGAATVDWEALRRAYAQQTAFALATPPQANAPTRWQALRRMPYHLGHFLLEWFGSGSAITDNSAWMMGYFMLGVMLLLILLLIFGVIGWETLQNPVKTWFGLKP